MIPLDKAKEVGAYVVGMLSPHFERIEIAGSVRRRREYVNDIDLVAIPGMMDPRAILQMMPFKIIRSGPKLAGFQFQDVNFDIYYATEKTWGTLLLIRTGSMQHNIMLCNKALDRGGHLYANGDGIFDSGGSRIAGDTEESIFRALGLDYKEPWEREV